MEIVSPWSIPVTDNIGDLLGAFMWQDRFGFIQCRCRQGFSSKCILKFVNIRCRSRSSDNLEHAMHDPYHKLWVRSIGVFEGTLVIGLILRSLWGLYKIHETLWFYLVTL